MMLIQRSQHSDVDPFYVKCQNQEPVQPSPSVRSSGEGKRVGSGRGGLGERAWVGSGRGGFGERARVLWYAASARVSGQQSWSNHKLRIGTLFIYFNKTKLKKKNTAGGCWELSCALYIQMLASMHGHLFTVWTNGTVKHLRFQSYVKIVFYHL